MEKKYVHTNWYAYPFDLIRTRTCRVIKAPQTNGIENTRASTIKWKKKKNKYQKTIAISGIEAGVQNK